MPSLEVTDPARLPFSFEEALGAGDVDAVLALFAPDAAMRTLDGQVLRGSEALRSEVAATIAAGARLTNTPRQVLVAADTALVIVDWTLDATAPDGTRINRTGTTANIARRNPDGNWQFTVLNPRGTT